MVQLIYVINKHAHTLTRKQNKARKNIPFRWIFIHIFVFSYLFMWKFSHNYRYLPFFALHIHTTADLFLGKFPVLNLKVLENLYFRNWNSGENRPCFMFFNENFASCTALRNTKKQSLPIHYQHQPNKNCFFICNLTHISALLIPENVSTAHKYIYGEVKDLLQHV